MPNTTEKLVLKVVVSCTGRGAALVEYDTKSNSAPGQIKLDLPTNTIVIPFTGLTADEVEVVLHLEGQFDFVRHDDSDPSHKHQWRRKDNGQPAEDQKIPSKKVLPDGTPNKIKFSILRTRGTGRVTYKHSFYIADKSNNLFLVDPDIQIDD